MSERKQAKGFEYLVEWADALKLLAGFCTIYRPCGQRDCRACFPGKVLPPDQRGAKKAKPREKGYRLQLPTEVASDAGEFFQTRDAALAKAKRLAKAEQRAYVVLQDGKLRWTIFGDGSDQFHEDTQAG